MAEKIVMNEDEIRRALVRIAHEIIERNHGCSDLVFAGMVTRGAPISRRLSEIIKGFENIEIPTGTLDIGLYRDDISYHSLSRQLRRTVIPTDITAKNVVIVDDVLYTGRSIRAAMDAIMDFGRPKTIQLAVLIDRGHRELPIRADFIGKNLPTAKDEEVEVRVKEIDGIDEVAIIREISA